MAKSKTKQEHYLPRQSYLDYFTDKTLKKPGIWVYKPIKDIIQNPNVWSNLKPMPITPHNLCKEGGMYETPSLPQNFIEANLGTLEGEYKAILEGKIIRHEHMTETERVKVSEFISVLEMRTPSIREHDKNFLEEVLEKVSHIEEAQMNGKKSETHIQLEQIIKDQQMFVQGVALSQEINRWILGDFCFLIIPDEPGFEDIRFITSDFPVSIYDFTLMNSIYGVPPFSPTIEVTVPLTPKIALLINNAGFEGYQEVDFNMVGEINNRTIKRANKYLLSSAKIDEPLLRYTMRRSRQSILLFLMSDELNLKDLARKQAKFGSKDEPN